MFYAKLCVLSLLLGATTASACEITAQSINGVRLDMTVQQVKQKWPKVKVARSSDGEGVALIALKFAPNLTVIAFTDEADPDKPVNMKRKIIYLATRSPVCKTQAGVAPQMKLSEVEKKYGRLRKITLSEIEAREFAEFSRQPSWLGIQIESDSGIFSQKTDAPNTTKRYKPQARIEALSITKY